MKMKINTHKHTHTQQFIQAYIIDNNESKHTNTQTHTLTHKHTPGLKNNNTS